MTRAEQYRARLLEKIREAGAPVPDGAYPVPTYATRADRSAGAWVWRLHTADGMPCHPAVGSQFRQSMLRGDIEVSRDRWGDWSVDPVRIGRKKVP